MPPLPPAARALLRSLPVAALALSGLAACGSSDSTSTSSASAGTGAEDSSLHDQLPDTVKSSGTLKLGALWETPPMISVTAGDSSKPVGIAPDLAAAIAPVLGVKVQWQNMQWPAQLPGVQSGVVHGLLGQVTDTADRESSDFDLVPYFKTTESLLMSKDDADGISALADMCGKKIGVPVGSTQTAEVKAASKKSCASDPIDIAEYQGATMAINAVKSGAIDAWLDSTTSQDSAAKADPDLTSVVVPDDEIAPQYTALAVSKKNGALATAFAGALTKLIDDGTYAKILEKYDVTAAAVTTDEVKVNPLTGTAAGE